jgi:NAD(P)-dependent dehydrogenase (short-subunit alcohol dehydrogenase family)
MLLDRNPQRSSALREKLMQAYHINVQCIGVDMEDILSVRRATEQLLTSPPDVLICNAGAYSIPRHKCDAGYDNVFQINFISPYYMIKSLLPALSRRGGRVVVVGSIAHNYSKIDPADVDFSTRSAASKVYGNAKRYLMFSLYRLFEEHPGASLSIVHPGISFTGITAHYPPVIFAIIKHPMKVIFMKPQKASLSILQGCFDRTSTAQWIGPRIFDVWGLPKKKKLRTFRSDEADFAYHTAQSISAAIDQKAENQP